VPIGVNVLAALGITNFEPFSANVETANSPEKLVGTRREWRIKQQTGELRGISVREKNKTRKAVGWLDKRSPGWGDILASYEAWRRTARYAVGTLEQPAREYDKQPTGESVGNVHESRY